MFVVPIAIGALAIVTLVEGVSRGVFRSLVKGEKRAKLLKLLISLLLPANLY